MSRTFLRWYMTHIRQTNILTLDRYTWNDRKFSPLSFPPLSTNRPHKFVSKTSFSGRDSRYISIYAEEGGEGQESPVCFSTPLRLADMCIRAGIDTYPTRDLARFNERVWHRTPAHKTPSPNGRESRRIYAISGHGLRRQSAVCALAFPRVVEPGWSRWRSLVREYLLLSVFLSSAASRSLSPFLSLRVCNENAWAPLSVIGGSFLRFERTTRSAVFSDCF